MQQRVRGHVLQRHVRRPEERPGQLRRVQTHVLRRDLRQRSLPLRDRRRLRGCRRSRPVLPERPELSLWEVPRHHRSMLVRRSMLSRRGEEPLRPGARRGPRLLCLPRGRRPMRLRQPDVGPVSLPERDGPHHVQLLRHRSAETSTLHKIQAIPQKDRDPPHMSLAERPASGSHAQTGKLHDHPRSAHQAGNGRSAGDGVPRARQGPRGPCAGGRRARPLRGREEGARRRRRAAQHPCARPRCALQGRRARVPRPLGRAPRGRRRARAAGDRPAPHRPGLHGGRRDFARGLHRGEHHTANQRSCARQLLHLGRATAARKRALLSLRRRRRRLVLRALSGESRDLQRHLRAEASVRLLGSARPRHLGRLPHGHGAQHQLHRSLREDRRDAPRLLGGSARADRRLLVERGADRRRAHERSARVHRPRQRAARDRGAREGRAAPDSRGHRQRAHAHGRDDERHRAAARVRREPRVAHRRARPSGPIDPRGRSPTPPAARARAAVSTARHDAPRHDARSVRGGGDPRRRRRGAARRDRL